MWRGDDLIDAAQGLADAAVEPARLGPRDGLAFISSNAFSIGYAALLVVDARRLLDAWLTVAALSFEAAAADPVVLDARIHSARHRPGQAAVAQRMRELLAGLGERAREPGPLGIQDPYPFRAQPQVDGTVHDALRALEETVSHELNFAGENALIDPDLQIALPNGNPHAAPLANAIDGLRTALASSAALIAARVSTLLDTGLTGLPPFLARHPGPESGALVLEYTAHAAVAEVRSLVTPVAAQTVSVSRGRRIALQPGPDRGPPRPRDAPGASGRRRHRARRRHARAAPRRSGARGRRHQGALAARRRSPRPRSQRPAAAPRRRGRPRAHRGLGGRDGLTPGRVPARGAYLLRLRPRSHCNCDRAGRSMVRHPSNAERRTAMRSRLTKAMVALAAVSALAVPAMAQASHGSDDPAGHVRHEHHRGEHHRGEFQRHRDRPDRDRGDRHDNDRHDNDRNDDHGGDR